MSPLFGGHKDDAPPGPDAAAAVEAEIQRISALSAAGAFSAR
jgi:hypothetical protein